MRRRFTRLTFTITALATGLSTGCRKEPRPEIPLTAVQTTTVEHAAGSQEAVRYSGSVTPYTQVEVAFKVGGYVRSILTVPDRRGQSHLVQAGDSVHSRSVLATVQPEDYAPRVAQ